METKKSNSETTITPLPWQVTDSTFGRPEISAFMGESKITLATCDFSHIRRAFAVNPKAPEIKEATSKGFLFDYNAEYRNAAFIVKACNNHHELRKQLEYARKRILFLEGFTEGKADPTDMSKINSVLKATEIPS